MGETFTVTIEPLGREVRCATATRHPGRLPAGRRSAAAPRHARHLRDASATCSTPRTRTRTASSFALMDFERDEGKTLTCCAKPLTDVTA